MTRKDILLIERIITLINELDIITKGKDDNYFYNGYEMPILCDLVDKVDKSLNKISSKLKLKYNNVNWNIVIDYKEDDDGIMILKIGSIWQLSSGLLKNGLLDSLKKILKEELPLYYKNYCEKKHLEVLKKNH